MHSASTGGLRHGKIFASVGCDLHVGGLPKKKQEAEREEHIYAFEHHNREGEGAKVGGWNFERRTSRNNKGTKCRRASGRARA